MLNKFALSFCFVLVLFSSVCYSQFRAKEIDWTNDGNAYLHKKEGNIVKVDMKTNDETVVVKKEQLVPAGASDPLSFEVYSFSPDYKILLIFTNTAKVWRYHTRGDYWVLNVATSQLTQLGKGLPSQSLMFAKISPDGSKAAYVSEHNLYVEDLSTHTITPLTKDGTRKFINGTFDWVYEEELDCRDGFRWSPDSKLIAFWQIDATKIRDYYMLNTTDSPYSKVIPVEYPKVGEPPSPVRIGVITVSNDNIKWMDIPGDPQQHYLPRMEWANNSAELVVQQLNRKQNESKLFYCNAATGAATNFYTENDAAFIDIKSRWNDGDPTGWDWLNDGKNFLWVSEKDGWRHIYLINRDGKKETLVTKGNYDIDNIKCIDDKNNYVYFMASPDNATQLYLYRIKMDGKGKLELLSPANEKGTHEYNISPYGKFALHTFSNHNTPYVGERISLPDHKALDEEKSIAKNLKVENNNIEYFKVTTQDNITFDGWMVKPDDFDSTKKYPVVFYVYGEPAASTVGDSYGAQFNFLYNGNMQKDGYILVSVDNRGTPSLRGAAWRKSIYGQIGRLNIHDQAMAAKKLLAEKKYMDTSRVAVWGWSGGGSSTLNLMFQYPEIYKTGISVSAVDNLLFYDNIYEERYMGLPQENMDKYVKGSPVYYAKNLEGNLLFIHGTGDDNVQYDNAEAMLNELIKYNKTFQFMPYPNRTHSISEGAGTRKHLSSLYTEYLRKNCAPGPR